MPGDCSRIKIHIYLKLIACNFGLHRCKLSTAELKLEGCETAYKVVDRATKFVQVFLQTFTRLIIGIAEDELWINHKNSQKKMIRFA